MSTTRGGKDNAEMIGLTNVLILECLNESMFNQGTFPEVEAHFKSLLKEISWTSGVLFDGIMFLAMKSQTRYTDGTLIWEDSVDKSHFSTSFLLKPKVLGRHGATWTDQLDTCETILHVCVGLFTKCAQAYDGLRIRYAENYFAPKESEGVSFRPYDRVWGADFIARWCGLDINAFQARFHHMIPKPFNSFNSRFLWYVTSAINENADKEKKPQNKINDFDPCDETCYYRFAEYLEGSTALGKEFQQVVEKQWQEFTADPNPETIRNLRSRSRTVPR